MLIFRREWYGAERFRGPSWVLKRWGREVAQGWSLHDSTTEPRGYVEPVITGPEILARCYFSSFSTSSVETTESAM